MNLQLSFFLLFLKQYHSVHEKCGLAAGATMVTFCIALLLAAGLSGAKLAQKLHMPSVTGYIVAGLLLGPAGLSIVTSEEIGHDLDHFTQIALMLIAFGIGEHIEIKKLKKHAGSLFWIGICEAVGAFLMVSTVLFAVIRFSNFPLDGWETKNFLILALLFGSIGIATAPAATLLVIRELKAKGPLTSTLMAIVAIDDGLAIMVFGLVVSIAHQLLGHAGEPLYIALGASLMEIVGSLLLGICTAALFLLSINKLRGMGELMTGGLATLLLCGEAAYYLHLSPLLAGMTAGFTLVNKAEKDVRIFRALNRFEPPIYVLFFALAGTHLELAALQAAGIFGLIYFLSSVSGKIIGIQTGGFISGSPATVRKYLPFAMMPQAGVAIGLIFMLSSDETLASYTQIITPVVLAGVFISELTGPLGARFAITRAGEADVSSGSAAPFSMIFLDEDRTEDLFCPLDETFRIIPWDWLNLPVPERPDGHVLFHVMDPRTARGLARIATIIASWYRSLPLAIQIRPPGRLPVEQIFRQEFEEVHSMGYSLKTELAHGPDITDFTVGSAAYHHAHAVVMAYPLTGTVAHFRAMLARIASDVHCPVAVVRFWGELHTERILVPITDIGELADMIDIISAFNGVGEHRLRLLYLASSTDEEKEVRGQEQELSDWLQHNAPQLQMQVEVTITHSRLEVIRRAARDADLLIMHGMESSGVEKFLFGSLVDSVSMKIPKTLIVIYNTGKSDRIIAQTHSKEILS